MTAMLDRTDRAASEVGAVAARYAAAHYNPDDLRRLRDGGLTASDLAARWRAAAALGWAGMTLPESCGGANAGLGDLAAVATALGRALATTPLSTTTLAAELLAGSGGPGLAQVLARVADGECLAVPVTPHLWPGQSGGAVTARADAEGVVISGRVVHVPDAPLADLLLVVTESCDVAALVDPSAAGVNVAAGRLLDSRPVATIELVDVAVPSARTVTLTPDLVARVVARSTLVVAAELLGVAEEAFDRTLTYLKQRTQFGVPIGAFQALQHRAADLWCELALARAVLAEACAAVDTGRADARDLVHVAKAKVSDVAIRICEDAIQMHGGIGMCDECDIGLFLKRARVGEQLLGDSRYHRDRYAVEHDY
jgi:acyl-CoA dehydrogenase